MAITKKKIKEKVYLILFTKQQKPKDTECQQVLHTS